MRDKLFWLFMLGSLFMSILFYSNIACKSDYRYNKSNEYGKKPTALSHRSAQTKN